MLRAIAATPLPITLLIFSFLCPTEFSLYVGGLRLPPHRVALLVFLPLAVAKLFAKRSIRPKLFDALFLSYNIWTLASFMSNDGFEEGLKFGGSLGLESFVSYLMARVYIRDLETAKSVLGVLLVAVLIAGVIALPETLLGAHFVHETLAKLTGYVHPIAYETRLGLTRAYGTFDHPIHFGTFCASIFAMLWYCETRFAARAGKTVLVAGATMLGLSSAPLLCLGVQGGLIVWDKVTRPVRRRCAITLGLIAFTFAVASAVMSRSPFVFLATGLTLDPSTGFYRTLIWQYGLENVWAHASTGIGLAEWERPAWMVAATIDTLWLVVALRMGVPAFLMLIGAILLVSFAISKRAAKLGNKHIRGFALGWTFSLIALMIAATTVHFWNVLHTYFFFFLGMAAWIADPVRHKSKADVAAAPSAISYQPRLREPAWAGLPPN